MARRSGCEQILEIMGRDPRLRTLPVAARLLWLELVMAMKFAGVSVLRFGERIPCEMGLATIAAIPVSEIAANVDALVGSGLLTRDADGALASPMLAAAVSRSEINRANALAGVAKRRARAVPGQMEMRVMAPVGGTEHRTASDPPSETAASAAVGGTQLAIAKPKEALAKQAVSDADFHAAGQAAAEAAGFDPVRWTGHYGIVRQWLADGATIDLIRDVISAKMAAGARPNQLGYFTKAIGEALARPRAVADLTEGSRDFTRAMADWYGGGRKGPMPHPSQFQPGGSRAVAA